MNKIAAYTICGVAGIALLFNALSESDADIARKPHLADQVLTTSMQKCDLQSAFNNASSYEQRLQEVLMDTRSKALEFVIDNDITVCLDKRMSKVEEGFFDRDAHALYFPKEKVISLYDSGKNEAQKSWYETAAISYSGKLLKEFTAEYDNGDLAEVNKPQFGYRYSTGKATGYTWKDDAADYGVIQKNPELLRPPLK